MKSCLAHFVAGLFLFSWISGNLYCQDAEPTRPNIVFFLVDDLGWQDTSVAFWKEPTEFQSHYRTPNVAMLANQGIRFSRAYSYCVCSPTRSSIMTGQNPARHRVTNWTFNADRETSGQTNRLLPPKDWNRKGLQPDQMTLPKLLRGVGYKTIHCGKAHWGSEGTRGADPTQLGFDVNIAGHHAGGPGSYQGKDNYGADPNNPGRRRWAVPGLDKYHGTNIHLTDALAMEASTAIESATKAGKPFFLYMAPYAVHTPIQQHVRFIDNYRGKKYASGKDIPEAEAKYASLVQGYDDALGQILNKVEQLGQSENTIVIFTSDNGGLSAHARGLSARGTGKDTHCWPLREGKGSAYEGGIRVPLIVSWAKPADNELQKRIPVARDCRTESIVVCDDYLPTICNWAGVEADSDHQTDGQDFTSVLSGKHSITDRSLFFHYPHVWGPRGSGYQPHSSLISGTWKLIYFFHARRVEMYDLANDIGEQHNLYYRSQQDGSANAAGQIMFAALKNEIRKYGALLPETKPGANYIAPQLHANSDLQPIPSNETRGALAGWGAGRTWMDQHQDINKIAKQGEIELVFIGDSITQSWGGSGRQVGQAAPQVWEQYYAKRKAVNFGISGDGFRNVLWRIENGNLDGINPKVVVLHIGTNDLARYQPQRIARGIEQIVLRIEERRQRAKILLMGIFPRGATADDPMRIKANQVNKLLQQIADNRKTFYLDIGEHFINQAGKALDSHYRDDFLHLSPEGYQSWATAIEPFLVKHLK